MDETLSHGNPDRTRRHVVRQGRRHFPKILTSIILATAIGVLTASSMVPWRLLWPSGPDDVPVWMDGLQNAIGQRYYFHDVWRWPVLDTRLVMPPGGLSIAMTDAVPLITLPAKVFRSALSPWFTTIGLWLALCFVTQPIAAVLALRALGEDRRAAFLSGAIIAECMPLFRGRTIHPSPRRGIDVIWPNVPQERPSTVCSQPIRSAQCEMHRRR